MDTYILGNWLRCYFKGQFKNEAEAWSYLSKRFLLSFPLDNANSTTGRHVQMYVNVVNERGFTDRKQLRCEPCEVNTLPADEVLKRCEKSSIIHA